MKVKDLLGENKVCTEVTIQWFVKDQVGVTHVLEVPGFYIPTAGVHLLSPQVLL